ncbi:MAG TPA: hypothetical protein EYG03_25945 [Planctomycetes bacterium]|nr:hypothetical protein [Fuerstiella sp.]HIK95403.1 hypothetical protein [Planctomycetota bacterium]
MLLTGGLLNVASYDGDDSLRGQALSGQQNARKYAAYAAFDVVLEEVKLTEAEKRPIFTGRF